MNDYVQQLKQYTAAHSLDFGNCHGETVLDQLFLAYQDCHDCDPPDIKQAYRELDVFLDSLDLPDCNDGFLLVCKLCQAYEKRAFIDGVQYGANLLQELFKGDG